ncbi:MAG: LacI family transcriptional regulator, partial [Caldilineae bacterium]
MAVTIYDVAKAAGVGISTVSRVLNESQNVRPETRRRVLDAIEALGYKPNIMARNLSRTRIQTVGVVLSYLTNPFQVAVLQGIEKTLSPANFDLTIYSIDAHKRRDVLLETLSHGRRADGLILISFAPPVHLLQRFRRYNIPVVITDFHAPNLPSVYVDNVRGGRMATKHLLGLGRRRIGFILENHEDADGLRSNRPGLDRLEGYRMALEEAGLPFDPELVAIVDSHARRYGYQAAEQLLGLEHPPDAIFACSDTLALGVIQYAAEHHVTIPEELALIGYDDIELASFANLTTVRQAMNQLGSKAAELVMELMAGEEADVLTYE